MFTLNDVLTLAKAGFNAQQIGALVSLGNGTQQQTGTPQLPTQAATYAHPTNQTVESVGQYANPMQNQLDAISQQMSGITQMLQLGNIVGTQQPQPQSTDDILASIIMPPQNTTGGDLNVN